MTDSLRISRRTVLKGLGTALALPWLEAMLPVVGGAAPAGKVFPTRMAFFYIPNGVHMPEWTPSALGQGFKIPAILQPLAPFQEELLVLSGLTLKTRSSS